ncbi:MAG: ABC transporter permease [Firmicutes bacterium]|nr:ABC transporter permease [Bacillota bacterium]
MGAYIIRRVLSLIPVLSLVAVISFLLIHIIPGDPAAVMLGTDATPQEIAKLREDLGLNVPLHVQFYRWISKVLRGDLGDSFFMGRPVAVALAERLPATILLAVAALFFALLIGMPAGIIAAVKRGSIIDQLVMIIALIGVSLPSFWIGLNLILVFSVALRWLPSGGYVPLTENFFDGLRCLLMPAFALGFMQAALIARMTRSSMLEVLRQDYIRTARSKGLSERVVVGLHALKNAMIPILTVIGTAFGVLLGGAVIVETVFAYPGIGRLVVSAVQRRDYPVIQGALLLISSLYVLVNLLVDILYTLIDPRIKYN